MDRWAERGCAALVAASLLTGAAVQTAPCQERAASADEIAKISDAVPERPYAKPARPRRMLILSKAKGGIHDSIPVGIRALEILGRKTGAYQAVVSHDRVRLAADSLKRFDVVCLLNAVGTMPSPSEGGRRPSKEQGRPGAEARLGEHLTHWVRAGGGVVAIHGAIDAFPGQPEFRRMIGAAGDGQPWLQTVTLKNDDPDHPVNAAFGGKGCRIKDEIYQFKAPYSRGALRVLMSLDVAHTRMDRLNPAAGERCVHRTDDDFAVSWVRSWGKGRVFYCSLGHRRETFWNPLVLKHYLAGIQFAAGDLKADTTPSADLFKGSHPAADAPGFQRMFNAKDTGGWTCKPGSWAFEDGVLARKGGGDIWSRREYGDFVLDLEFKVARGTNSGVFLRTGDVRNWVHTAIEVQIYDSYAKARPASHDCGAIFDCLAPAVNAVRAPGRWNRMTITARGPRILIVLNRKRIIDMDLNQWTQAGKNPDGTANKFKTALRDMPRKGRIGLQDHGHPVWFRNVRIQARD